MKLPFVFSSCPVDLKEDDSKVLLKKYQSLLSTIGEEKRQSHNFLLLPKAMVVVPRVKECFGEMSINSLGFLFTFLTPNEDGLRKIEQYGCLNVLQSVCYKSNL